MPDMRRQDFITLVAGAALWPLGARAQSKPARIAMLGSGAAQSSSIFVDALKQGLADNGLIEEQGYVLDVRWAEGEYHRFPALAAEVVSRNPNVATTIAAVRSAQRASVTIPIVMSTINDPVGAGLVASPARHVQRRPDLLVINDASILDIRMRIMALALQHGLPVASSFPEFTDAGALVGYGSPRLDLYRRAAYYVKRILDGAKPADLPVEQPTRIELSVNLRTAKTLGIAMPASSSRASIG